MLVRQLEDEVVKAKTQASQTNPEVKAHMEALQVENDHLTREIAILRETAKVSFTGVDLWNTEGASGDQSCFCLLFSHKISKIEILNFKTFSVVHFYAETRWSQSCNHPMSMSMHNCTTL